MRSVRKVVSATLIAGGMVLHSANAAETIFSRVDQRLSDYGYVEDSAKWKTSIVQVCWENPDATSAQQRLWVEQAIEATWEKAAGITLTGWARRCVANSEGIHILIADDNKAPQSLIGAHLDRVTNGMRLNFTFRNWGSVCIGQEHRCIWNIAVHEFGHAIGFLHESLRDDAPEDCKTRADVIGDHSDPGDGSKKTPYDANSVMNYCNQYWINEGKLSELDVLAARTLYGPPRN